jgi:hypothetical protein
VSADSRLGDWALKSTRIRRKPFIVGVNERTLMAVVFAWRPLGRLPDTFATCVAAQLEVLGIPGVRCQEEFDALRSVTFGRTRSRSHLGVLNEVTFMFEAHAEDRDISTAEELLAIQTDLNEMPHRASKGRGLYARDAIRQLLGAHTLH